MPRPDRPRPREAPAKKRAPTRRPGRTTHAAPTDPLPFRRHRRDRHGRPRRFSTPRAATSRAPTSSKARPSADSGPGIEVWIGHDAARVRGAEAVVRSSAIRDDNAELVAARTAGLPIVARGALLADVLRTRDAIAIAGSHGKTTTTAMAAHALECAGGIRTASWGGRVPRLGRRGPPGLGRGEPRRRRGRRESDGSFLLVRPIGVVVTNVDPEHLDHYGSREALLDAFVEFANAVPFWGASILGVDHPGVREIAPRITARKIGFGFAAEADVRAESVLPVAGGQHVRVALASGDRFAFQLAQPGRHNVLNALAAIAIGLEQGIAPAILAEAMASFPGVSRRFEARGEAGGVRVVDDYAHHPAEIRAALAGARSIHPGPITAIFQPHRYTRTRDCWDDFVHAFDDADRVVLADVYPASERPIEGIDSRRLAAAIAAGGKVEAAYGGPLDAIEREWPARLRAGELVLTIGAGDVVSLGPKLLAALGAQTEARA
ncbi:MAG: UDP-N-acetylmuramate--L-alanine ligase [Myxococcota bacterium]